ncbi:uncharacterized protein MONOS_5737 [Monocercomonoides exilis]|uniref:uncharacterized protein n=1 Tax=Monocercomonoides exilis TaxID=2049356 RepID=UPI003559AC06|nr:hypothetical protein MONOS_5737 [Monocercomonoides exilis]|eukprot:MONOS_5737.1-p1 / transcript=MONOS_5737.1 / gene=MONOS_5737 / organism=Monocercomonoides_exilis_PA203 / gene_product=unspecified product / transcript_product=unspecified product / location=Mono_scaffold00171:75182-77074(-) / protein_length=407 / sequence_SO=supercontig / SO=protein_coding / is_pseudo=false
MNKRSTIDLNLNSFPDELLALIFSKCDCSTIVALSQVNSRFNRLSKLPRCVEIKCRSIVPFIQKINFIPKCAFFDISLFNPQSEEDWQESYKFGVSPKGWSNTQQIYKKLSQKRYCSQLTLKSIITKKLSSSSGRIKAVFLLLGFISFALGLICFSRNCEIAYKLIQNDDSSKKSFTDTLTFCALLIYAYLLIGCVISYSKQEMVYIIALTVLYALAVLLVLYFDFFWKKRSFLLFSWPFFAYSIFVYLIENVFPIPHSLPLYTVIQQLLNFFPILLILLSLTLIVMKANVLYFVSMVYKDYLDSWQLEALPEELKKEKCYAVEGFLWLREQFGLPKYSNGERLFGFNESEEYISIDELCVGGLKLKVSNNWLARKPRELELKLQRKYYETVDSVKCSHEKMRRKEN